MDRSDNSFLHKILFWAMGLYLLISLLLTAGCTKKDISVSKTKNGYKKNTIQIGMSFDSFVIERWQRDRDVFVAATKELGADVYVQNANGDYEEQLRQIDYFIDKKMDVIVIISVDSDRLASKVMEAKKAGIKVVAYDRLISKGNEDLYISFDNEEVGRMMAETLVQRLPEKSDILMIQGPNTDHNVSMLYDGFKEVIKQSTLNVVGGTNAEGWRAEAAFDYLDQTEIDLEKIAGIMCGNDSLAGQAIKALSMQRLAGNIVIVGQDADIEACQRIVEGTQCMTVYKPIEKLAKRAAECVVDLANGKKIEDAQTINDGTYEVPYVKIQPIKVTKENMDEIIIDGGFHLREEVYLNLPEE